MFMTFFSVQKNAQLVSKDVFNETCSSHLKHDQFHTHTHTEQTTQIPKVAITQNVSLPKELHQMCPHLYGVH